MLIFRRKITSVNKYKKYWCCLPGKTVYGLYEPGNKNSILIECVLTGLFKGNTRTKEKEKEKNRRKNLRKRSIQEEKTESNDQYFALLYG